jgi:hypothetical protein
MVVDVEDRNPSEATQVLSRDCRRVEVTEAAEVFAFRVMPRGAYERIG